jgi:hypothetical protein
LVLIGVVWAAFWVGRRKEREKRETTDRNERFERAEMDATEGSRKWGIFDRRMVVELPTDGYHRKSGVGGAERAELEVTREPLEGHF